MKPQNLIFDGELIPTSVATNSGDLLAVSSTSAYLPRLQLYGGNSEACKEGTIPIGHFGVVLDKETIEDVGKEVEILVINGRAKAMDLGTDDGATVITVYDRNDAEFKRIAERSEEANSGCMFGPEFLVYVPKAKKFATFFMSSKTARREAGTVANRIAKAGVLTSKLIKGTKFSWHGPKCAPLDTITFELPPLDEIHAQEARFMNPPKSNVEKASEPSRDR